MKLQGQVALITGAGRGIGAAIARELAGEGATLVLAGRSLDALKQTSEALAAETLCVGCDVREESQASSAVEQAVSRFGRLDLLVNNAGLFLPAPFEATSAQRFDDTLATNLKGPFFMSKAAWPHLRSSRGQIVMISSMAGVKGYYGSAAYCSSKFGLNGLAEVLALEGWPHGIRVITICPGSVGTDAWKDQSSPEEIGRMMKPESVAEVVRCLVTTDRGVDVGPVVLDNVISPFGE